MDVALLCVIAAGFAALIFIVKIISRRSSGKSTHDDANQAAPRGQPVRRVAAVRNARRRMRGGFAATAEAANEDSDEEVVEGEEKTELGDSKLGTKKRAKLEAKAEKKLQREAADREREERKKRELLLQEESDKRKEKERVEEQLREEALKNAREEKEKRELEEYMKLKETFSVEEEGYNEKGDDEHQSLLQEFVQHIKQNKVVILEDLAAHFGIKTASCIERINELQANGTLTGVIDDRGKFIYISQEELEAVAKFVRQQGRISITELAENSNRLINLNPGSDTKIVEVN